MANCCCLCCLKTSSAVSFGEQPQRMKWSKIVDFVRRFTAHAWEHTGYPRQNAEISFETLEKQLPTVSLLVIYISFSQMVGQHFSLILRHIFTLYLTRVLLNFSNFNVYWLIVFLEKEKHFVLIMLVRVIMFSFLCKPQSVSQSGQTVFDAEFMIHCAYFLQQELSVL